MLASSDPPQVMDVRESDEFRAGHLEGAHPVPRGFLEMRAAKAVPDPTTPVIAYCAGGVRSLLAGRVLREMGYETVYSMTGGFSAWKDEGRPFVKEESLDDTQRQRYLRHTMLPEVGETGQQKLLGSRVLLLGAGGLGSPTAYYLAAAGVGTLGIVDFDRVDFTNLQRQILHRNCDVGRAKIESARETLAGINPDVKVVGYDQRLDRNNIMSILDDGWQVVVDGCDNFPTRYLVNDACVLRGLPNVHGSIYQFEGQATVFAPGEGPCYRCLFPTPPPPEMVPSCQEAGVLGVLPGTIGLIQATETVKWLLGLGTSLVGRLLAYDALDMSFREMKLRRNPECPVCGDDPAIKELLGDYGDSCALP